MLFGLLPVKIKASMYVCAMCFVLLPAGAYCQNSIIQYEKVFKAQSLTGKVQDGAGSSIRNVLVQVCDKHWDNCSTSTNTNEVGEFSFPSVTKKQLYYLRLSAPLFNPLEVKVKTGHAGKELVLQMQVAT